MALETGTEVRAHLHRLHEAVWELTAIALALGDPARTDSSQRRAAEQVLLEAGLLVPTVDGAQPSPGLAELISGGANALASQVTAGLIQSAALLSGITAWSTQDDEAILAQGQGSGQFAEPFKMFALPQMEGLPDLLSAGDAVMLDVGVGVAGLAVAFCRAFPGLRVVGLDVFPRALELARRRVHEAGLADRIELRRQDFAELDDLGVFCLAWLPGPFVPRPALEAGLPRLVDALIPGGWVLLGHGKLVSRDLSSALTRFQTVAFGGSAVDDDEAQVLLRGVGLQQVTTLPTPEGAPALTVGCRQT